MLKCYSSWLWNPVEPEGHRFPLCMEGSQLEKTYVYMSVA